MPKAPTQSATIELREKQSFDWPLVMACVARIGKTAGACAWAPWRRSPGSAKPAMDVLGDRDVTPELAAAAGEAAAAERRSHDRERVQGATREGGRQAGPARGRRIGDAVMELKDPNSPSRNDSSTPADAVLRAPVLQEHDLPRRRAPGPACTSATRSPTGATSRWTPAAPTTRHVSPRVCQPGRECFTAEE